MAKRAQNEKEFGHWENFSGGGRRYWRDRAGAIRGLQRMVKIVDMDENTLFVIQEIYNEDGELIERHQKFPVDTGHEILKSDDEDQTE